MIIMMTPPTIMIYISGMPVMLSIAAVRPELRRRASSRAPFWPCLRKARHPGPDPGSILTLPLPVFRRGEPSAHSPRHNPSARSVLGIFGGKNVQWAKLRFNPEAARWVRHEEWHPDQRLTDEPDGSLVMELPFTDERELTMDVLKHGGRVEVLEPKGLRKSVGQVLSASVDLYR
jgi:hypothetical protein